MKKIIFVFIASIYLITFLSSTALARSGCCSHHNGVCGCSCCDGTPLSATCAPYYPSCNKPVAIPTYTPPTPVYTPEPEPVIPTCPANAYYSSFSEKCECRLGYIKEGSACVEDIKEMDKDDAEEYLHIPDVPDFEDTVDEKDDDVVVDNKTKIEPTTNIRNEALHASTNTKTGDSDTATGAVIGLGALAGAGYLFKKFKK